MFLQNVTNTHEITHLYSSKCLLFIKHLQWEQKLKTCPQRSDLVYGNFIKVFYKTITSLEWPQDWLSYTSLTAFCLDLELFANTKIPSFSTLFLHFY